MFSYATDQMQMLLMQKLFLETFVAKILERATGDYLSFFSAPVYYKSINPNLTRLAFQKD